MHVKTDNKHIRLTLTRVVFESQANCTGAALGAGLTLTRVVFELSDWLLVKNPDMRLTLTRVVFE